MLKFRLYHTLHLQYHELFQAVCNGFEINGIYGLHENKLIFEGNNEKALGFCFKTGALEECPLPERESLFAETDEVPEIRPETDIADLFKFLFTILRRCFKMKPCADDYMLDALCKKLNKKLIKYNGHCFLKIGDTISFAASDHKEIISLESLAEKLSEVNQHMKVDDSVYADYQNGQRERKFCRFAEAENFFLKVLSAEQRGSILYQETCFEMGEVYYFTDRLNEAVQCYRSCDFKLLDKGEELFLRLGYCLAEMKQVSENVRFLTKCRLNGRYMAKHKASFAGEEIPLEELAEYTRICETLGKADWEQNFSEF